MIGSKISVAVADAKGNKDVSDETAPVAVYKDLEILDAEQKGAKTIEATFSEAITTLDKLTVSKNGEELKQAYAPKIADDGLSATITLENRITAGTYTVTLTPAADDPSSATFEGEVAALSSIEFVSDYLIMKDNEYKEGYAYIKGMDQFGEDMSLSSVTVIPGYGHFRSYDATTGKITIGVDEDETNFAIVKEVPVFVTYQNGADTIPANATLKVTTMSYVQDLTFGDIYKADGSKVDDDTNPLMIGDLKSKPYVEILDVEDQYGNKLSAKDLNDQATGNTKVLFVIPDESTTSAYYSTGKFSTITEKDGTKKTILYLAAGGDMPGSMDLIITGASGQSFSKPVTVQDDPYIDTLRVNYPTLYEGTDESDALEFTAVDQYEKEIKDLFNFAPTVVNGDTLKFNDANHLTGQVTRITAPNGVNWVVKKDNINKKFTVSIKLDPDVKKGATLVMMATTAGLKVTPTNLTVGQRTNGESIDTTIGEGGNLALDPQNQSFDFNKYVRFLSSNGTVMDRVENEQYPVFLKATTNDGDADVTTDAENTYKKVIDDVTEDKPGFFWTVSLGKEGKVTGNKDDGYFIVPTDAASTFDENGKITIGELDAANKANGATDDTTQIVNGETVYKDHKNATYYVTLYKASKDSSGITVAVIDKQSFKLTYSPTKVDNVWQTGTQYTAELSKNRAIYADEIDTLKIKVKAYPNIGQPYYVDDAFITVTGKTSDIYNNGLNVFAKKAGTATFSVYVQEPGDTQGVYTTLKVTADDKQTATKVQKDFDVVPVDVTWTVGATPVAVVSLNSKTGSNFIDSSRTATEWSADTTKASTVSITNGVMEIINGNRLGETLELGILDQHDLNMEDAKFFVDGLDYATFVAGANRVEGQPYAKRTQNTAKHIIEVRSADDKIIAHYTIELGDTTWNYTEPVEENVEVDNWADLKAALEDADPNDVIEIAEDADITAGGAVTIPATVTLKVPAGSALDTGNKKVTINGTLEVEEDGEWYAENAQIENNGNITGDGDAYLTNCTKTGNGTATLRGTTLHLIGGSIAGWSLGGHVEITGITTISDTITLLNGVELDLTGSTLTGVDKINIPAGTTGVTITDQGGNAVEVDAETGDFVLIDGDADDANEVAKFLKDYETILGLDAKDVATWYDDSHDDITTALAEFGSGSGALSDAAQEALTTEKGKLTNLNTAANNYAAAKAAIGTNDHAGTLGFKAAVANSAPTAPGTTKFSEWETKLRADFEAVANGEGCTFKWGASKFEATSAGQSTAELKTSDNTTLNTSGDTNTITYTVTVSKAGYEAVFTAKIDAAVS